MSHSRENKELACRCRKLGVDTPIIDGIYRVIHEGADARGVVTEVMSRELRPEVDPLVMAAAKGH